MERDYSELEELLPESSTQLVSLNTRVPRFVSKMVDESVGILQTQSDYLKVSKQVAIQILIERGYQVIKEEFERMDFAPSEVAASIEPSTENIVRMERETNPQRTYDMKAYSEFSNKSSYEPRKHQATSAKAETVTRLQSKLGLR